MSAQPQDDPTEMLPLRGVRVLDFSWLLPGPFCTMHLADLGADVIKIEGPGGDYAREMLPGLFAVANRNKRSLGLNLKAPGALEVVDRMVRQADVVVEGFRPGVADRLGIGHARLATVNPRLVYASVSGFGAQGPLAARPGHDINYLAMSGALSIPGQGGAGPARGGLPVADLCAAMTAGMAILAALLQVRAGGRGCFLDVAMLPALMSWAQVRTADHLAADGEDWPHVNPLNDLYEAADGRHISLALVEPKFMETFCALAGCPDLPTSEDWVAFARSRAADAGARLRERVRAVVRGRTAMEWEALLGDAGVPFARVLDPAEALEQPQLSAAGFCTAPAAGLPRGWFPFPVPGVGRRRPAPAPARGAHSAEVLAEFGLAPEEVARLQEAQSMA